MLQKLLRAESVIAKRKRSSQHKSTNRELHVPKHRVGERSPAAVTTEKLDTEASGRTSPTQRTFCG